MATTSRYNALDYLGSSEDMAAYIKAAKAENDPTYFLQAVSNVLQARSIIQLSAETGIDYKTLCKMLNDNGEGHPPEMTPDAMERVALALTH